MVSYDTILFDLDGTLWDASTASANGWNAALNSAGLLNVVVSPQDIKMVSGRPFLECVKILLPDIPITDSRDLIKAIGSHEKSRVDSLGGTPYPDVVDGIADLAERYELFLVSNCQDWYLDAFWQHVPVKRFFRASDCYGRSRVSKSRMIERIVGNYALEKPIYVGDTVGDEQAAHSAKIDFGYAAYGFGESENPTAIFQSFGDLVARFR